MIKIIVNGAKGRMGQESVLAISKESDLQVVYECDHGDDLEKIIDQKKPDVVLDFTVASTRLENAQKIIGKGVRPVIGTSGFKQEEVEILSRKMKEKKIGGIIAPNFAIGAVLMMKFAKEAAKYMSHVEIIELHHDKKEDFPSGTALKTAELIAENLETNLEADARAVYHKGIPIHSVRLPGFVAHQEVIFGGPGQVFTLRHDSINRESFMPGVVMSCRKVMELDCLVYGLENIL
jgi:4-hydroxy-tetrahydrodipicolinate reductase